MQIFSSVNLYCQISTVSADGKAKSMGEGDVEIGVSDARVEWQEGEGVRERTSPRSVDCEPLVCQLRREWVSAGRGSAAATGFQISQYECLPRPLTLGLSGSRNNKIPIMKPDTVPSFTC